MKNVYFFLTIVSLAIVTQAATLTWGSGSLYKIDSEGNKTGTKIGQGNAYGYIFFLSEEEYNVLNVADIVSTYFDVEAVTGKLSLKSGVTADGQGSSNKSSLVNFNQSVPDTVGPKYYAAVVYTYQDIDGVYGAIATKGWDDINSQGKQNNNSSTDLANRIGNTGWVKYAPVPEPTTVALLAFGLAAVGLKRKRA